MFANTAEQAVLPDLSVFMMGWAARLSLVLHHYKQTGDCRFTDYNVYCVIIIFSIKHVNSHSFLIIMMFIECFSCSFIGMVHKTLNRESGHLLQF